MKYDLHFSMAALVIYVLLLFTLRVQYNNGQNTVRKIRDLIICLFLADFFDIVSACTVSYQTMVPVWINYVLNGLFFVFEVVCMAMFPRYVRFVIDPEKGKKCLADKINDVGIGLWGIVSATSFYTHLIYYFDEGHYKRGILYNLNYVFALYFLIYSFIRLWQNKHAFSKRQFYSIISFILISICGSIFQFVIPGNTFVLYFSFSIAAFVMLFGLETPDYIKLEKTLKKLEQSQEELREAAIRAEAADVAKSDFLANMSHEIRTPINAVLGMNELISRESTEASVQSYSSNIADAGQTLPSLINDILDFSKIEAGRMELAPTEYELSSLLREVYNIISIRCQDKGLKFEIRNNTKIPNKLYGDDVRIRQILVNLLNNALKYTDEGEVCLSLEFREIDNTKIELEMAVSDTGIGIREEDLSALFVSFKRIDPEKNRKREGTGLGLNITKSFVEMMGGSLNVESVYGEGSVFTVRIIQEVRDRETIGLFGDIESNTRKGKYEASFTAPTARILVVDDVKMNLTVMKGLLKQTGINIDMAMSGQECLDMIKNTQYDMIFLDHMMPEMDGVETMKLLQEDKNHFNQNTPVIMLTANAILGEKEKYISLGFTDYLSKPVQWKELEDMLVKYLPKEKVEAGEN